MSPTPSDHGKSNWRTSLEPQLSCPCGIANRPHATPLITIEDNGLAVCQCGKVGPVQMFLPSRLEKEK